MGSEMCIRDSDDILEYSKIFTGLTWADRTQFGRGALNDTSYIPDLVMWNSFHEPGVKNLLNGFQVPDRNPVDGVADIEDALQNLFDHPNTPPFVCKRLIQRMVTSNPSPAYVNDCLLYTSDAADERSSVDLGGRRIIKKNKQRSKKREYEIVHTIESTINCNRTITAQG